jgi:cytoskeletal protein RodZ
MVTREAQRLRRPGGVGAAYRRFTLLLVAAAIGVLGIGGGPALAQGSGPEKPPVKTPVKLGPEPAPVAGRSVAATGSSSAPASSASQASPSTTSRPAVIVTPTTTPTTTAVRAQPRSAAVPRPKPPPPAPAKPKAKKAVESAARGIQAAATRIATFSAAPPGSSNSNRLLFLGGLALLVLVLGDAAFLAFSARVLREPPDRY